jgi:hypothetical protein
VFEHRRVPSRTSLRPTAEGSSARWTSSLCRVGPGRGIQQVTRTTDRPTRRRSGRIRHRASLNHPGGNITGMQSTRRRSWASDCRCSASSIRPVARRGVRRFLWHGHSRGLSASHRRRRAEPRSQARYVHFADAEELPRCSPR